MATNNTINDIVRNQIHAAFHRNNSDDNNPVVEFPYFFDDPVIDTLCTPNDTINLVFTQLELFFQQVVIDEDDFPEECDDDFERTSILAYDLYKLILQLRSRTYNIAQAHNLANFIKHKWINSRNFSEHLFIRSRNMRIAAFVSAHPDVILGGDVELNPGPSTHSKSAPPRHNRFSEVADLPVTHGQYDPSKDPAVRIEREEKLTTEIMNAALKRFLDRDEASCTACGKPFCFCHIQCNEQFSKAVSSVLRRMFSCPNEAQAGGWLQGFFTSTAIDDAANSVTNTLNNIDTTVNNVETSLRDQIASIPTVVKDFLDSQCGFLPITFRGVLQIIMSIVGLYSVYRLCIVTYDIFIAALQVVSALFSVPKELIQFVTTWSDQVPQAQAADMSAESIIGFIPHICGLFCSALSFYLVKEFPNKAFSPDIWMRRVRDLPSTCKSINTIFEYFVSCFKRLWSYVKVDCLGYDPDILGDSMPVLDAWMRKVVSYTDQQLLDLRCQTREGVIEVTGLWAEGEQLMKRYGSMLPRDVIEGMKRMLIQAARIKSNVEVKFPLVEGVRAAPLCTWLVGESQIGKTLMQYFLSAHLCKELKTEKSVKDQIYCRTVENEYWDGYHGQDICVFDDFGQMRDSPSNPNTEFFEIIRSVGTFPYNLHMADISQKANTTFTSKVIIASTNNMQLNVESLTYPDAVWNRITHAYYVTVKAEYLTDAVPADFPPPAEVKRRLDIQAILRDSPLDEAGAPVPFNPHIYEFRRFDARYRAAPQFGPPLSFDQVAQELRQSLRAKLNSATNLDSYLSEYSRNIAEGGEWDEKIEDIDVGRHIKTGLFTIEDFYTYCLKEDVDEICYGLDADVLENCQRDFGDDGLKHDLSELRLRRVNSDQVFTVLTNFLFERTNTLGKGIAPAPYWAQILVKISKAIQTKMDYYPRLTALARAAFDLSNFILKEMWRRKWVTLFTYFVTYWLKHRCTAKVESDTRNMQPRSRPAQRFNNKAKIAARRARTAEMGIDENQHNIMKKVMHQQFYLTAHRADGRIRKFGTTTIVTGSILMMPDHFRLGIAEMQPQPEFIRLQSVLSATQYNIPLQYFFTSYDLESGNFVTFNDPDSEFPKDLCFVDLSTRIARRSNIIKHFVSGEEMNKLNEGSFEGTLSGLTMIEECTVPRERTGDCQALANVEYEYKTDKLISLIAVDVFLYHFATEQGDCGSILTVKSNTIRNGKIVGFHIAGGPLSNYSQAITREDVEMAVAAFPPIAQCAGPMSDAPIPEGEFFNGFHPVALRDTPIPQFSRSNIKPSSMHRMFTEPITKPARLRPFELDGVMINPLERGARKAATPRPPLNPHFLEIASRDMEITLKTAHVPNGPEIRVLTHEEAIQGIPGHEMFNGISRSTSPGYPFNLQHKGGGKKYWMGKDDYEFDTPGAEELKEICTNLIEDLAESRPTDIVWVDTLKDERRPLEKVRIGKTRVFSNGPMHFNIVFRQYFLALLAFVRHNRIHNGTCVGINVWSTEWDLIARMLSSNSLHILDGDQGNHDGNVHSDPMWELCHLVNRIYNDGIRNFTIRLNLFDRVIFALCLLLNKFYHRTHGFPSGCVVTADFTSWYQLTLFRYIYLVLAFENAPQFCSMNYFHKFVTLFVYGDDNVVSISPVIIDWFNMETLTVEWAKIGHEYTDACKTQNAPKFKTLGEVQFLKRAFKKVDDRAGNTTTRYHCPADLASRLEMLNWTRHGNVVDPRIIERDTIQDVLKELAMHGYKEYSEWSRKIVDGALSVGVPGVVDEGFEFYLNNDVNNMFY